MEVSIGYVVGFVIGTSVSAFFGAWFFAWLLIPMKPTHSAYPYVGWLRSWIVYYSPATLLLFAFVGWSALLAVPGAIWESDCRVEGIQYCSQSTIDMISARGDDPETECFAINPGCFNTHWMGLPDGGGKDAAQIASTAYGTALLAWLGVGTLLLLGGLFMVAYGHRSKILATRLAQLAVPPSPRSASD